MLIAAIDTSGRRGSVALARGTGESCAILEVVSLAGGTYSARLIPDLSSLLDRHGLRKQDLEGFAVVSGPGSFTGLRVGLSTVKGLAEILRRPIAAVSMLEAIARRANEGGFAISALDAGRRETYVGEYKFRHGEPALKQESLLTHAQFAALLAAHPDAELVTPDANIAELAPTHLRVKQIDWPDAAAIAHLGLKRIDAGQTVAPEDLEANYLRRSDAEIFSRPESK